MRSELNKFANLDVIVHSTTSPRLNWENLSNSTGETLLELSRTVVLISCHQIAHVIGGQCLSKMVKFDKQDPIHVSTAANLTLMHDLGFETGQNNEEHSPAVWKISGNRAKKTLQKIMVLHVQFARVFMDEGHKVRNAKTQTFGWLKYIQSPVWIVSGSSGWMPPKRWSGWVKLWQQQDWATNPNMKWYTSNAFSTIKMAFIRAARDFDPASGIPSPIGEIDEDGYDPDKWQARNRQHTLGEGLRNWSKFLQQAMIRRTHQDRVWGARLLTLPRGEIKVICVKFCDVGGEVQRQYQAHIKAAVHEACPQSEDEVRSNPGTHQDLAINIYRRCRIASSIPALCCIQTFKQGNWDKASVSGYRTERLRGTSPFKREINTIIRLSPKLLWLRDFLRRHLTGTDEKLLIFSFSPIVLHCVDLVWPLLPVLYHNLTLVTLPRHF